MKKISLIILALLSVYTLRAQDLGKFQPKTDAFKSKKLAEGNKKLYIASFNINFEIYKEAVDSKEAGGFGRSIKNAAKAKAAVGLSTLDKEAIQAKADQLYMDFINNLKAKGYELISADEAGNTETYQGFKKAEGPNVFETEMTGILSVVPTGYSYYYKDRNAFSSKLAGLDKTPQNLSQELDDALVADVSLVYVFSEVGNNWNMGRNQAKVKLSIDYRLANLYNVTDENTSAGLTSLVDKNKQAVALNSYVNFTRGKLKIGGSAESQYKGFMKSDLQIFGVLKEEEVVAYSTQTQATATLQNPIVSIRGDNYSETTKWLEPDGQKYAAGMYLAGSEFINYHLEEVFE